MKLMIYYIGVGGRQTINKINKLCTVLSSDMINAKEKVKGKTDMNFFFNEFIFGCVGSLLLCAGFL